MKKLTILLLTALVPMMALAQTKRKPAAGKPATTAKATNNKFAIVLFDEWIQNVYEDTENIYFQDTQYGDNNALRAVNKQTGTIRIVVVKKSGNRSRILCSGCDGKTIYMQLEGKGIVRFNGTDVNTSEVLLAEGPNNMETNYLWPGNRGEAMSFSPNGRYLAMKGDPCIVFDTQAKKVSRMVWRSEYGLVVTDNGDFYAMRESGVWKYPDNGGVHPNVSNKLNDKGIEKFSFESLAGSFYGEYNGMYFDANKNVIFVPVNDQMLKFSIGSQQWSKGEWTELNMVAKPQTLEGLKTGIKLGKSQYESPEVVYDVKSQYRDTMGNLWIQTSDKQFVIYNPDGIKGLSSLIGKCTKNNLP